MCAALALFLLWTASTWFLEGRLRTLLRPEAVADRIVYAVVANLLIGTLGSAIVLALAIRSGAINRADAGFGVRSPSIMWLALGAVVGLAAYVVQGAPIRDPVVIVNVFAQVFVVSAAEVLVCWAVLGSILESVLGAPRWLASLIAAVVASGFFGLYHFGHSPPFDTLGMVVFLAAIGLVTSAFFLVSRDIYATIVFHNFLGVIGVIQSLAAAGRLGGLATPQVPLLAMAVVTLLLLVAVDALFIRRIVRDGD